MSSIISKLQSYIDNTASRSRQLFQVAHSEYTEHGRGALWIHFTSVNDLDCDSVALPFFPLHQLQSTEYENGLDLVRWYDPQTHYVIIASVDIYKPQRDGPANSIMNASAVLKEAEDILHTSEENTPSCYMGDAKNLPIQCARCELGNQTRLRVCERCRTVRYCTKECQIADWSTHKERCRVLKATRDEGKQFLRDCSDSSV